VSGGETTSGSMLTRRQVLRVLTGVMAGMLLAAVDQTIVATALPAIVEDLGGLRHLAWVVTAYLLTSTVALPLYGKLSDLHGRKPMYRIAILVFLAGSLGCAIAQSMSQLIAFRALQGAGAGGLMAMAQATIGDVVSPRERGRYTGYVGAMVALATVIGPLVGGYVVDNLSWRWIFLINLPTGGLALWLTQRNLPLPLPPVRRRIDYLGAALLTGGIVAILLVSAWGGTTYAWSSPVILALGLLAFAALAVFLLVETHAPEPILPLEIFRYREATVAFALLFITGAIMFAGIVSLPLFLQIVVGASATSSGLLLLPLICGLLASVIASGRLIARWGRYKVFPILGTALMSVGVGLMSTMGARPAPAQVSAYLVVVGLGLGLVLQVPVLAIQNAVPVRYLGAATSASLLFRSIGGALGVAVFGALLNARVEAALGYVLPTEALVGGQLSVPSTEAGRTALSESITGIFGVAVPVILVAFGCAWLLRDIPLRTSARLPT
jgi:EmrB/QacA subfamily drug resistance transporter